MMSVRISLERFDGDSPTVVEESADYKRGFADGTVQTEGSQSATTATAIKDISSTLNDISFGFEEARLHLIERLHPIIEQIAEAILPQIARETFGAHLSDILDAEFQSATSAPIQIAVAPEIVSSLSETKHDGPFVFVPDPTLQAGQALIRNDDTHVMLDLPALLNALQNALYGLESPERNQSNG